MIEIIQEKVTCPETNRTLENALGRCVCGVIVELGHFTCTCDCGREYNWNGTELAPREQWGEETGESEADIMGPMSREEIQMHNLKLELADYSDELREAFHQEMQEDR
jgi:hypothetical protein